MRSALFVDEASVRAGLGSADPAAAALFADDPAQWVRSLAAAGPRRFLLQVCYLRPDAGHLRRPLHAAGFRVVDRPACSDVCLVLDVLDALDHPVRLDEVVLASDADLSPLLHRLRAHDRRSAVVRGGAAAEAFRGLADVVVDPDALLPREPEPEPVPVAAPDLAGARPGPVDVAAAVVRALVSESAVPVPGALAAHAARAAYPQALDEGWAGTGSFSAFLAAHVPQVCWSSDHPGHLRLASAELWDPAGLPRQATGG